MVDHIPVGVSPVLPHGSAVYAPHDNNESVSLIDRPPSRSRPLRGRRRPYAFLYMTVGEYQSAPFFADQGDVTTAQYLLFSFTTLTTTGYGDLVPAGNPGQTLAISGALLGQLFLVTPLGKIVANLRPRLRADGTASDT